MLRVGKCPITSQSTSLGTTGCVDDFACRMLGAGVREPQRWRPPSASCLQEADPAWNGHSGHREGNEAKQAKDMFQACQKRLARRPFAMTRRNGDGEPKKETMSAQRVASVIWDCANCHGAQNPTRVLGQENDRANSKRRPVPPASVGGNLWADTTG